MVALTASRRKRSKMNVSLVIGIVVLTFVVLFGLLGPLLAKPGNALVGAVRPSQPPTAELFFGSDTHGRDVFTTLVLAVPTTMRVGIIAGLVSLALGLVLGLLAGFFSGTVDWVVRTMSDVLMAVPVVAFLILIVARMQKPDINLVAVVIAVLTWPGTARGIRAQILSIRERAYTAVARASGESELEVLFREIVPNLLPLMMASFIGAVTAGIYAVMSLEMLGLGPKNTPTLGMMIFWSQRMSAVLRGQWWAWSPPIAMIALIFIGLFMLSSGLDRYVNPSLPTASPNWRSRLHGKRAAAAARAAPAAPAAAAAQGILEVRNLQVAYEIPAGAVRAVDGVSFSLRPGERMGLIGESGSGKTTMATAILGLSRPPARVVGGEVLLEGRDLLSLPDEDLRKLRLKEIALIPQAAMNSLNPVVRVGPQIKDAIVAHMGRLPRKQLDDMVAETLARVGLRPAVANRFPHQLSGGMKQRVVMAIGIVLHPKVIIADEPTSALDVVVQHQVMLTLGHLQQELGAAVVLIGHDMGLIGQFADTIGVLYAGKLIERGSVQEVLDSPLHPYTRLLIESLPTLDGKKELVGIPGLPPALLDLPPGCAFAPRCPEATERCRTDTPDLVTVGEGRQVACHR